MALAVTPTVWLSEHPDHIDRPAMAAVAIGAPGAYERRGGR